MSMFETPEYETDDDETSDDDATSYQDALDEQQAEYDAEVLAQEEIQGLNDRDSAYTNYLDAAGTAADYVTGEIAKEQSNANLLGVDYNITDEQKATRINDYFATLWGEGDQLDLENLMGTWGNPDGFTEFSVTRGDASVYEGRETPEETLSTSSGIRPKTLATNDDEDVLGTTRSVLGA